jgi:hypothetical protein
VNVVDPVLNALSLCAGVGMLGEAAMTGRKPIHGLTRTPEYRAWQGMRLRCTDPEHKAYPRYGGRGIKVCDRWLESVENFIADMGPKPTPAHELDRFPNNDGNYEPGNCRWATRSENCRNRRSSRFIESAGERLTLAEWAARTGLRADLISERVERGWTPEAALSTPARRISPKGVHVKLSPCIDCGAACQGNRCRRCEDERKRNGPQ